jgi:hypothetical protein
MMVTLVRPKRDGELTYFSMHNRQGNLFSPYTVTVVSGDSLRQGKERQLVFDSQRELDEKVRKLIRDHLSRGYRVLYSYFRANDDSVLQRDVRSAIVG